MCVCLCVCLHIMYLRKLASADMCSDMCSGVCSDMRLDVRLDAIYRGSQRQLIIEFLDEEDIEHEVCYIHQ